MFKITTGRRWSRRNWGSFLRRGPWQWCSAKGWQQWGAHAWLWLGRGVWVPPWTLHSSGYLVCTCRATILSVLKRLICRSCQGRKSSGDRVTLPSAVNYASIPKQTGTGEGTSRGEDAHTSVETKERNGNGTTTNTWAHSNLFQGGDTNYKENSENHFKKREPISFDISGSTGFSGRLAAT